MKTEELEKYLAHPDTTVVDALQKIDKNAKGVLFITDEDQKLLGTLTDGDVRRWLIKTGDLQADVEHLMNKTPKFVYANNISQCEDYMKKWKVKVVPVVAVDGTVCDVVFADEVREIKDGKKQSLSKVPVIIMAGGKGTRLYPYTKVLPKPLIPIGDIPIMERIIDRFRDFGVQNFYATLNYRKNMIKSYFSDVITDYEIHYVEEDQPLGTAGSLHLIEEDFEQPIIVTNCDILIQGDYRDIYEYHLQSGNELTIVTALKNILVPYGVVHSKENGVITRMEEKPKLSYFVNTGMYILNPGLLKEIPKDTFYHMTDLSAALLEKGRQVGMYPISEDSFLDMGEFEEMRRMEQKLDLKTE
ncbi:MAG: nucleotidyltransferase family protein [Lachnospiraceae bacterium]|nr:nucleotidyltransferase family protein [Lachnospiraceae bacterium]